MISDADRAVIDAAVEAFDVSRWAPLNDAERDLVSRAFTSGRVPESSTRGPGARGAHPRTTSPGRAPGGRADSTSAA